MFRLATMVTALADTALAVVIGLLAPLTIAATGWLLTGSFQEVPWEVPLAVTMALWTLGLTSSVGITITPQNYPGLGLTEPFAFVISLAPLTITAFIGWFAWHTGRRIHHSDRDAPWLALAVSTVAFILLNQLTSSLGATDLVRLEPGGMFFGGTLLWLLGLLVGARAWEYLPWPRILGDRADTLLRASGHTVRLALGLVIGTLCLAGVLVLIGLVLGMGEIIGLTQLLQLDGWGNVSLGLTELLYLPTLLVWAASWLLGAGVQLGTGSMATPGATEAGPLPVLPLLGIVPEPQSPVLWAVVAAPVLGASLLTMWLRREVPELDQGPWWHRLAVPAAASVCAAVGMAWLAYLSRGALGPDRLTDFGPVPWQMLLAALAVFLVGGSAGAFIPVGEAAAPAERHRHDRLDEITVPRRYPEPETPSAKPPELFARDRDGRVSGPGTNLADAVNRPDEPDIYADLDGN